MSDKALQGWITLIISCIVFIFRNLLAKKIIECQNNIGFNFGEKEIRVSKIVIVIACIGVIIIGLLDIIKS
jgi:hypothetical protein